MTYLQKGCPNYTQRGNFCAIPLKKVKLKVENQEAIILGLQVWLGDSFTSPSPHMASPPSLLIGHSGTKHYRRMELCTELRIAQPVPALVGFI
jgi:hypothetical protein